MVTSGITECATIFNEENVAESFHLYIIFHFPMTPKSATRRKSPCIEQFK